MAIAPHVAPGTQISPIFRPKGQRSRWLYPHDRLSPEHAAKVRNINLSEFGAADSRWGYDTFLTSQLGSAEDITGLRQQTFKSGTQQIITTPTKVYTDNGSTQHNITGSLSLNVSGNDDRYRYAFLRDTLIACNGKDELWTWSGDFSTPANAAAISFAAGSVSIATTEDLLEHRGTLISLAPTEGSTKYPTRVRWSDIDRRFFIPSINNWPDNNRYEIYEDGPAIVGGADNFGRLLVFKKDGLYPGSIEYQQGFLEFRLQDPIRGFSPIAKASIVKRPEFVFGVAREGAFVIRPDLSFEIVTLDIQDEWNKLNQSRLQYAQSFIRARDHQVRTLLSSAANTSGHDLVMVWDWETGDITFDVTSDKLSFAESFLQSDVEYDWYGTVDGYAFQGNDEAKTDDNGTGYNWNLKMTPNDLGYQGRSKHIIQIISYYKSRVGQQTADMTLHLDQGDKPSERNTLDLTGATWDGSSLWTTGANWNSGGAAANVFFVNRVCEELAPEWSGNQPASIAGYQVVYQLLE